MISSTISKIQKLLSEVPIFRLLKHINEVRSCRGVLNRITDYLVSLWIYVFDSLLWFPTRFKRLPLYS